MTIVKTWRIQKTRFGNVFVRTVTREQMREMWPKHQGHPYFCAETFAEKLTSALIDEVAEENQFHYDLKRKPLCCADAFVKPKSLRFIPQGYHIGGSYTGRVIE